MKGITLSILQFDADAKAGNYEGIKKFIDEFEPIYEKFLKDHKYRESEFKKELKEVIDYIFTESEIIDIASKAYVQNGELVKIRDLTAVVHLPYVKRIYDIINKYDIKNTSANLFNDKPDPLNTFVAKHIGQYKENGLSIPERALIAAYNNKPAIRGQDIYNDWLIYRRRVNRFGAESNNAGMFSQIKTQNKIDRIEKIIPYLDISAQQTAIDELTTLKTNLITALDRQSQI